MRRVSDRVTLFVAGVGWLAALGLTWRYVVVGWTGRMPFLTPASSVEKGMSDFRDTALLPNLAIERGVNPYDLVTYHDFAPHAQFFNPYAPWWLTVTRPLSALSWDQATLVWSCVLGLLTVGVAIIGGREIAQHVRLSPWLVVPWCLTLLWLWRPVALAHGLGNIGALVAVAAGLALLVRNRWLGAVLVAIAWIKPQYGLPLGMVMLVMPGLRARYGWGSLLAVLASVPEVIRLASIAGGLPALVSSVIHNVLAVGDESAVDLMEGRVDIGGLAAVFGWYPGAGVSMAIGAVLLLVVATWGRRLEERRMQVALLLAAAVIVSFPHFHYDLSALALLLPGALHQA